MHDRRGGSRTPAANRLLEHVLGVRLDLLIDREPHVLPGVSGCVSTTSSARPNGSLTIVWLPGLPASVPLERPLEPLEPLVVETRIAEHLRRDGPLRVGPELLGVEAEPGEAELLELFALRGSTLRAT